MVLSNDRKADILNLFSFFDKERTSGRLRVQIDRTVERVAKALQVKYTTVRYVCQEVGISTSVECKKRKKLGRPNKLDSFDKEVVRQRANRLFAERKVVSVNSLKHSLEDTLKISNSLIYKTLLELGFRFRKTADNKKSLTEGYDTVAQRCHFLRSIKCCREEGREIIYLDETWVNAHHCWSSQWYSATGACSRTPPSGKGQRLIILHAGSADRGFLPGCALVFRSKTNSADYHDEMNSTVFMEWFEEKLILALTRPSCIIIDNASYHNKRVPGTETPTTAWRKDQIRAWLDAQNIKCDQRMLKQELYAVAKMHKTPIKYLTDQIAEAAGHVVIRTPVRH